MKHIVTNPGNHKGLPLHIVEYCRGTPIWLPFNFMHVHKDKYMKFFKNRGLQLLVSGFVIAILYIPGAGCFPPEPLGSIPAPVNQPPIERKTINYPDGSRYEGPIINDQPHGSGVMVYPDGRNYFGNFKQGQPYGVGTMFYPDKRVEKGHLRDGQFISIRKKSSQ